MQPVRFCSQPDCYDVAVKAARSSDLCRGHYRSEVLAHATDLVTCEVLASEGRRGELAGVTDCVSNETVRHGGTVTLDPRETNIAALVAGGTVKVVPGKAAERVKAEKVDG